MASAAENLTSWSIGKVKITRVTEIEAIGGTRFILQQATPEEAQKIPWLVPRYATPEGKLRLNVQSWLVETPAQKIVVDTCIGNGKQGLGFKFWENLDTPYLEKLAAAGCPADKIDMVICTHIHVDHVGWNTRLMNGAWVPTFRGARYKFGKTEYEHCGWPEANEHTRKIFAESVLPVVNNGQADMVASDAQLNDEISLISSPGHSIGHMCVLIRSDGEEAVLIGDVAHHPCQMHHLGWSSKFDYDPVQSVETRRRIFSRFADTPTLVFGGHFDPGHIVRDGDAFRLID